MGLKESLFVFFIVSIIIFPIFFSIEKNKNRESKELPDIRVVDGYFKEYSPSLSKYGDFNVLYYYFNNDSYLIYEVDFFNKKEKNEWVEIKSKNVKLKDDLAFFNSRAFYFSKDQNLSGNNVIYNVKKETLQGNDFELISNKFKGVGSSFVYNNNIEANDIKYIIKDDK
jgi:hypothetical protein